MAETEVDISWRNVELADLLLEPEAQRETDPKRVEKMAADWDPVLCGALTVAIGEQGELFCTDGYHRTEAGRLRNLKRLHAMVITGLDRQDRARLFLRLQRERRNVSAETDYRVSVTAGEAWAVGIESVLAPRSLRVGGSPSPSTIAAVRGLHRTWDMAEDAGDSGNVLIALTVDILNACWQTSEGGDKWQTDVLQGVGRVLALNPTVDRHRLTDRLMTRRPRVWVTDAQAFSKGSGGSGGRPVHMAQAICNEYNRALRKSLTIRWR